MTGLRTLNNVVAARLGQVTHAAGYYGQIGRPLPGLEASTPKDPQAKTATDPRVAPYFTYYPQTPATHPDQALCGTNSPRSGGHHVTAVAGDVEDLYGLVDRIDALLHDWHIDLGSRMVRRAGYEAPLLIDQQHNPARLYVPLQYLVTTTT